MSVADSSSVSLRLCDVLGECSASILERWRARVDATIRDHDLSEAELTDHMPQFLTELTSAAAALPVDDARSAAAWNEAVTGWPSPEHGLQRLRDGFDVDEVVREYGILGDVVLATCAEMGVRPSIAEQRLLNASLLGGAGEAIAAYVRRRDADLTRLGAKHLAFIAHEVRNPLGTAWIAVDLLADRATDDMQHALQTLKRSLTRLRQEIDGVLSTDVPALVLEPETVDVTSVLRGVVADIAPEAQLRSVRVEFDVPGSIEVDGDARLLASAFGNVARNAVKFSQPGTEVRVRARVVGEELHVEVEDRCGGLPQGYEAMFRAGVRMAPGTGGQGLGLAIAKQAIEAHGGSIDVRNDPGVGCVMDLSLPIRAEG